jgi:hypothetical protein
MHLVPFGDRADRQLFVPRGRQFSSDDDIQLGLENLGEYGGNLKATPRDSGYHRSRQVATFQKHS